MRLRDAIRGATRVAVVGGFALPETAKYDEELDVHWKPRNSGRAFRGCGGELNRGPRAYHSGDYEEIGWILGRIREMHKGPIVAVGVSLGGNALLRWAGEMGESASKVVSAVASSPSEPQAAAGFRQKRERYRQTCASFPFFMKTRINPPLFEW